MSSSNMNKKKQFFTGKATVHTQHETPPNPNNNRPQSGNTNHTNGNTHNFPGQVTVHNQNHPVGNPPQQPHQSVPPRYQPPPQPQPGILKNNPNQPNKNVNKNPYPQTNDKFYPGPQHVQDTRRNVYPPGGGTNRVIPGPQLGIPAQPRPKSEPAELLLRRETSDLGPQTDHLHRQAYAKGSVDDVHHRGNVNEEFLRNQGHFYRVPPNVRHVTDEELLRLPQIEMLKFVRKAESDHARITNDQHRHLQNVVNEVRILKETNQRLANDNQELRDLCCFLDDDRQKGRKLAREWQRFGRYTASVMRQEVSAYQGKLRELDNKQQELIKDNLELKELCLYLDEERNSAICLNCGASGAAASATQGGVIRDDGDGSSSSTNADEPHNNAGGVQFDGRAPRRSASRERLLHESLARQRTTFNDQTMQYVRNLEHRIKQLEEDKTTLTNKLSQVAGNDPTIISTIEQQQSNMSILSGRPEAVVRALQVLEVREQLESESRANQININALAMNAMNGINGVCESEEGADPDEYVHHHDDMDDGEKALVREMCNVVWRKLEEAPTTERR